MVSKGEVDHVGGMAKVAVRNEVAAGMVFLNSEDCISFLSEKFSSMNTNKNYAFKEIDERELDIKELQHGIMFIQQLMDLLSSK